jgi:hypothetical protein
MPVVCRLAKFFASDPELAAAVGGLLDTMDQARRLVV